jgi:hypothetical protein
VTRRPLSESHLRTVLAAALGALLAGAYAHFVGCRTGTCLVTSSVWTAALYGGGVGAIAGWPGRPRRRAAAPERAGQDG